MATIRMIFIVAAAIVVALAAFKIFAFVTMIAVMAVSLLILAGAVWVAFLIARSALHGRSTAK